VPYSKEREAILGEGLVDLLARFGHHIRKPYIDANGEISLETETPYGEELAAILNTIPVRHGISPTQGHVEATGCWCRINHFDLEKLLLEQDKKTPLTGEDLYNANDLSVSLEEFLACSAIQQRFLVEAEAGAFLYGIGTGDKGQPAPWASGAPATGNLFSMETEEIPDEGEETCTYIPIIPGENTEG